MKKGIFTLTLICSLPLAASEFQVYTLKKGDNISQLLHERGYAPLYGNGKWVERVLDANKLIYKTAKKIDTGKTIFLPNPGAFKKPKDIDKKLFVIVKADKVITKTSAIMKKGLFANSISKHQDVIVDFTYSHKNTQFDKGTFSQANNTKLGIKINGKNNYQSLNVPFNLNGSVYLTSHGPGELDKNESKSHLTKFKPTYEMNTDIQFHLFANNKLRASLGPALTIKQESEIQNFDGSFQIERNLSALIGAKASMIYDFQSFDSITDLVISKKQYIGDVSDQYTDKTYAIKLDSKLQLTSDYFAGVTYEYEKTFNSNLESSNSVGFNLSYNLQ